RGPYMMNEYDAETLVSLLDELRPQNAQVIFNDKSVVTDELSPYYAVPYAQERVSAQRVNQWQSAGDVPSLALPAANAFIAEDVALIKPDKDTAGAPSVVRQGGRQTMWFGQDDEFNVPRGATYINFRSPLVGVDAAQTATAVIYTSLINDRVNEFSYPASLAGLNFRIYKHAQGISLRVAGYNDKQQVLLQRLVDTIKQPDFDPTRFNNIRKDMIRALENSVAQRPSSQVVADLREALLYGEWGEQPLIDALKDLTLDDVESYATKLWASATAEVMLYGNYPPEAVEQVTDIVSPLLGDGPAPALPPLKVLKLQAGEQAQYAVDIAHDDSVVAWYLQAEGDDWSDRAAGGLTAQIMKSGFFQQLRTEQQLGYVVSAVPFSQLDVPGIVMLVQSPSHDAPHVVGAMQDFMESVEADLSEDQFERHKRALISDIMRPDKNLMERAEFYWQSIARKRYDFQGKAQLADAVRAFTRESWLDYYNRVFLQQRHSLQVVAPGRWGELPAAEGERYDNATAIKAGHPVYVIE
ncbi:MAG: insulinase family protein, partial [Halieaceae bacterium]